MVTQGPKRLYAKRKKNVGYADYNTILSRVLKKWSYIKLDSQKHYTRGRWGHCLNIMHFFEFNTGLELSEYKKYGTTAHCVRISVWIDIYIWNSLHQL